MPLAVPVGGVSGGSSELSCVPVVSSTQEWASTQPWGRGAWAISDPSLPRSSVGCELGGTCSFTFGAHSESAVGGVWVISDPCLSGSSGLRVSGPPPEQCMPPCSCSCLPTHPALNISDPTIHHNRHFSYQLRPLSLALETAWRPGGCFLCQIGGAAAISVSCSRRTGTRSSQQIRHKILRSNAGAVSPPFL